MFMVRVDIIEITIFNGVYRPPSQHTLCRFQGQLGGGWRSWQGRSRPGMGSLDLPSQRRQTWKNQQPHISIPSPLVKPSVKPSFSAHLWQCLKNCLIQVPMCFTMEPSANQRTAPNCKPQRGRSSSDWVCSRRGPSDLGWVHSDHGGRWSCFVHKSGKTPNLIYIYIHTHNILYIIYINILYYIYYIILYHIIWYYNHFPHQHIVASANPFPTCSQQRVALEGLEGAVLAVPVPPEAQNTCGVKCWSIFQTSIHIPSGNLLHSYWKWPLK